MISQPLVLLLALSPTFPAAPAAPPAPKVKTGLRVVATIDYLPGTPAGKVTVEPAARLAVKIFPEKGDKAVKEVKTDDKGIFVVALPVGKYRVEATAFANIPGRRDAKRAVVEVKAGAVSEVKLKFHYSRR